MTKICNDFSAGWSGTLDLAKAADGMFDGRNVIVYRDGSIGPRPGLRSYGVGRTILSRVDGAIYVPATGRLVYEESALDDVYSALALTNPATSSLLIDATGIDALAGEPVHMFNPPESSYVYFGNPSTAIGGRRAQSGTAASGASLTAVAIAPLHHTSYGERIVAPRSYDSTVWFSEPSAPTTWTATNFFRVGESDSRVVFMSAQRGHLTMVTAAGEWFVLTGVPGVNATLRRVAGGSVRPGKLTTHSFVDIGDDTIHFLSPVNNYPANFDGAQVKELKYLSMNPEDPRATYARVASADLPNAQIGVKAFQGADSDSVGFVLPAPTNRMLLLHNGAWGLHTLGVDTCEHWASDGRGRLFAFSDTAAGPHVAYSTDLRLNRPAFTTDTHAQPGDNTNTPVDAYFTVPEQWSEGGDDMIVQEVVVDFKRWATGATGDNQIICTVEALGRGHEIALQSQVQTWTQPQASSGTTLDGTQDRLKFNFGEQGQGAGWRVKLSGLKGVAIRQVIVVDKPAARDSRAY